MYIVFYALMKVLKPYGMAFEMKVQWYKDGYTENMKTMKLDAMQNEMQVADSESTQTKRQPEQSLLFSYTPFALPLLTHNTAQQTIHSPRHCHPLPILLWPTAHISALPPAILLPHCRGSRLVRVKPARSPIIPTRCSHPSSSSRRRLRLGRLPFVELRFKG